MKIPLNLIVVKYGNIYPIIANKHYGNRCFFFVSIYVEINTQYINEDGWNRILKSGNIDYDWNKVKTKEEALVVILVYEAQHANHI